MDDEEALRILLAQALERLGYEVECARDGAEAIELYQKAKDSGHCFDIVLVDLTIPGGAGGKEVAARLREIDDSVVLIVSSGYSNTPIMSEFRSYGFNDVISKPWTPVELSAVLRRGRVPPGAVSQIIDEQPRDEAVPCVRRGHDAFLLVVQPVGEPIARAGIKDFCPVDALGVKL